METIGPQHLIDEGFYLLEIQNPTKTMIQIFVEKLTRD